MRVTGGDIGADLMLGMLVCKALSISDRSYRTGPSSSSHTVCLCSETEERVLDLGWQVIGRDSSRPSER